MLNQLKKLNNLWFKEEIKSKITKYLKLNENKNITSKLWDATNSVLRRKFIASNVYIRKEEGSQMNDPSFQLKELEKGEQIKPK